MDGALVVARWATLSLHAVIRTMRAMATPCLRTKRGTRTGRAHARGRSESVMNASAVRASSSGDSCRAGRSAADAQLCEAQLCQRRDGRSTAGVWSDAQLKHGDRGKLHAMVLRLGGRTLRTEVPLLTDDVVE